MGNIGMQYFDVEGIQDLILVAKVLKRDPQSHLRRNLLKPTPFNQVPKRAKITMI